VVGIISEVQHWSGFLALKLELFFVSHLTPDEGDGDCELMLEWTKTLGLVT
jgi:hypothetical protein